ncbi:uncharacterized protein LOC116266221 [Nymphaea colorata]|nr:uncharacterized protein LOC116266221 [Nymphaea colorata]
MVMNMKEEVGADVGKPLPAVRYLGIRRPRSDRLLLHRLHQNILYLKLRSLLPVSDGRKPSEVLPAPGELPRGVFSNDESKGERRGPCLLETKESNGSCNEEEVDDDGDNNSFIENSEEEEARLEDFVPTIKVRKMAGSLLISTVIQKEVALSSNLFRLLENEDLSIIFEHQYRTKTKVCHTIRVRVPPEMDIDAFKAKLEAWGAGKEPC